MWYINTLKASLHQLGFPEQCSINWAEQQSLNSMQDTSLHFLQYPVLMTMFPGAAFLYLMSVEVQTPIEMLLILLDGVVWL